MIIKKEIATAALVASCLVLTLFSTIARVEAPVQPTQVEPIISLQPNYYTTYVGDTFVITCMVYYAENLYDVEIQIGWDPTVLTYVNHTVTIPVETYPGGILHAPTTRYNDDVNESGWYWLDETSFNSTAFFTGDGSAFTMAFQAVAPGHTIITFNNVVFKEYPFYTIHPNPYQSSITVLIKPPEVVSVKSNGLAPYPYVHTGFIRPNEPVRVIASITYFADPAASILCYSANNGSWWNTTMNFMMDNGTASVWQATIPGQQGDSTIVFFIIATDVFGDTTQSSMCSFSVKPLLLGDVNGDGKVDILDVVLITGHYGNRYP